MAVVIVSLILGVLGVLGSYLATRRLTRRRGGLDPHIFWALGFLALLPAWLVVFVAMLGPAVEPEFDARTAAAWVGSAALGLLGAILTEHRLRRRPDRPSAPDALRAWGLGTVSLLAAWILALARYGGL